MEKHSRPKKHDKKLFKQGKCPNCGSEDFSEITGWCLYHQAPEFDGNQPYCPDDKRERCFIQPTRHAFECLECYFVFDEKKVADNVGYDWPKCPVGESYDPDYEAGKKFEEMKIKEYKDKLYKFTKYFESTDIRKLAKEKYYLEAIGKTHIQLARLLKLILSDKLEAIENEFDTLYDSSAEDEAIEMDVETLQKMSEENEKRKRTISKFLERATDYTLHRLAFIFGIIDYKQDLEIQQFNSVRNDFMHTFDEAEKHSDGYINSKIEATLEIIEKLTEKADEIIKKEVFKNVEFF